LLQLVKDHSRWGFDKLFSQLRRQGYNWNHKRVYRVYCELKLNIRIKPKKRIPRRENNALIQPIAPNLCWSIDFMSDALICGQKFRTLNILDDYNREALDIRIAISLPAVKVTKYLDRIAEIRGYPANIRIDNGPEFISAIFATWAEKQKIKLDYIQPGKPAQNGYIERFNRSYREDVLDAYLFESIREAQKITNEWLYDYNNNRPHQSLSNMSPIEFAAFRSRSL
jgi:putative transposase